MQDKACGKRTCSTSVIGWYMGIVTRRTLMKWTNMHLEIIGHTVDDVVDLQECDLAAELLSILSRRNIAVPVSERKSSRRQKEGWNLSFPGKLRLPS